MTAKGEKMKKNSFERSKGFTLVELMVVIAIIGILAVVALGIVRGAQQRARDAALEASASQLSTALEAFYADPQNGSYPDDISALFGEYLSGEQGDFLGNPCEFDTAEPCGISYDVGGNNQSYTLTVDFIVRDQKVITGGWQD